MFDSQSRTPARPHPIQDLAQSLRSYLDARRERRNLRQLSTLDADSLRDLGLTESDVRRALSMPLSQDAATELRRASLMWSRQGM